MFDEVQWGGVRRREKRDESEIEIHFLLLSVPLFGARYRTRATEFHREPPSFSPAAAAAESTFVVSNGIQESKTSSLSTFKESVSAMKRKKI